MSSLRRRIGFTCLALLLFATLAPHEAAGFTQYGGSGAGGFVPMGHEWITRLAAMELLGGDTVMRPDPKDPRGTNWRHTDLAQNTNLAAAQAEVTRIKGLPHADKRFASTYKAVYAAIIGERWVDIGGTVVRPGFMAGKYNCFDAVAQEPPSIQYDHFMRRYDEHGPDGAVTAIQNSQRRFKQHFVRAATASQGDITVWDGGGSSEAVVVDRNYFLFGRAVHLFEDSFSPEHTVRTPQDSFRRVRNIKSYLCSKGAEQHNHSPPTIWSYNNNGDSIWLSDTKNEKGWDSYKPSNMAPIALMALEGTKDLWAAFIRVMALPKAQRAAAADQEAQGLITRWLSMDPREVRTWYDSPANRDKTFVINVDAAKTVKNQPSKGPAGMTQAECLKGLGVKSGDVMDKVKELAEAQRVCIFNIEASRDPASAKQHPERDPYLHIPFYWNWKSWTWKTPPATYKIPAN